MTRDFAPDETYGSDPILIDVVPGPVPAEENHDGQTMCLQCGLEASECVCRREGA